ncbi:MAG: DUF2157 domain-containing protein [Erythrobacter sp.]|nr:DUF2157 domain-containing protein [Erythrobacter sp.]
MNARKINAWHDAGLIDEETRTRLIAYEDEHARPLALWAIFGIGALAIALGLISVVAANWDEIPGQIRLSVHFLMILGTLAALFLHGERLARANPWGIEALLFVAAALGLTFFGHLGQVYQTSAPLWEPLALWLLLFGPVLLLVGRSWLAAALVVGGSIYCAWEYNYALGELIRRPSGETPPYLWLAFVTALPVFFAPVGAWLRGRSDRSAFWRRLEQLGLTYAVLGASLSCALASVGAYEDGGEALSASSQFIRAIGGIAAGILVVVTRPGLSGRMSGSIIVGAGVIIGSAIGVNDSDVFAGGLFMILWAGIAGAALYAGWRGVFQVAVATIALRLIVLSFELASDLLLSGFGLIVSGFLILGVAWLAVRVSRRFAPPPEEEAST